MSKDSEFMKNATVNETTDFTTRLKTYIEENKPYVYILTPCYGGVSYVNYTECLISTIQLFKLYNININVVFCKGDSLVTRARNNLIAKAMNDPEMTHMLFIDNDITDKTVIVVDDSIVRGNTLKHLISLIKSYSPKSIHFVVASPPIKYTCHYGVDFADIEELVANNMSISQMVSYFGFDSLTYLDLDKINNIQFGTNSNFCNACFTGKYLF